MVKESMLLRLFTPICVVEMLYDGVHISFQLHVWQNPIGSLKSAMGGEFTPQKFAINTNQFFSS